MGNGNYVTRVHTLPSQVEPLAWDALLQLQPLPSPFMQHAYLAALHDSGSACAATGWMPHFITLEQDGTLQAACVVYLKDHSSGEYVFDWAWASAYAQHGVAYYPKAVIAVPFTPVPGTRLMARDAVARAALIQTVIGWCERSGVSSLHVLFAADTDQAACAEAGLMLRHTVQFHWTNMAPTLHRSAGRCPPEGLISLGAAQREIEAPTLSTACAVPPPGYANFDEFLASLSQEKRKKIRQERRKVADAGVTFRHAQGTQITDQDWEFFYRCYERTYLEHGNPPYLNRDFFRRMAIAMPDNWLLFVAQRDGRDIASILIAVHAYSTGATGQNDSKTTQVAYGRYWGALEPVDCLHFEACYYQPLEWCIAHGYQRFEGGAQGEHKMARALLPIKTSSAHWLAHPAFADAVARFLERESEGVGNYLQELNQRSPFRAGA